MYPASTRIKIQPNSLCALPDSGSEFQPIPAHSDSAHWSTHSITHRLTLQNPLSIATQPPSPAPVIVWSPLSHPCSPQRPSPNPLPAACLTAGPAQRERPFCPLMVLSHWRNKWLTGRAASAARAAVSAAETAHQGCIRLRVES